MSALSLNPSTAAMRALNALLARESWARERLRPHAGKTARLVFGASALTFSLTPEGLLEAAEPEAVPDVILTAATDKLAALLSGDTAQRMGAVRIEGDAALAHVIGDLARDLRWDVEDDLAAVLGDIPAARLVATASGVVQGLRGSAWRLAENVAEYLSEESGAVASSHALHAWSSDVRRLRDDAERAGKRVAQLEARLAELQTRLSRSVDKE